MEYGKIIHAVPAIGEVSTREARVSNSMYHLKKISLPSNIEEQGTYKSTVITTGAKWKFRVGKGLVIAVTNSVFSIFRRLRSVTTFL